METHYSDMEPPKDLESLQADPVPDYSGLKLYYTAARKYDAGVLSIGMFCIIFIHFSELDMFMVKREDRKSKILLRYHGYKMQKNA